jgi:hypothetical protein
MSKVVAIMSMSLDGYVADLNGSQRKRRGHTFVASSQKRAAKV